MGKEKERDPVETAVHEIHVNHSCEKHNLHSKPLSKIIQKAIDASQTRFIKEGKEIIDDAVKEIADLKAILKEIEFREFTRVDGDGDEYSWSACPMCGGNGVHDDDCKIEIALKKKPKKVD